MTWSLNTPSLRLEHSDAIVQVAIEEMKPATYRTLPKTKDRPLNVNDRINDMCIHELQPFIIGKDLVLDFGMIRVAHLMTT
jgi:hypothetical protein